MRTDSFTDFVLGQLDPFPQLICKAMFGGHGLYQRERFFGIIHKSRLYLKTNGLTQPAYAARGMQPFRPSSRQRLKHYYEVPVEILEDAEQLKLWAQRALAPPTAQLRLPFHDTPPTWDLRTEI